MMVFRLFYKGKSSSFISNNIVDAISYRMQCSRSWGQNLKSLILVMTLEVCLYVLIKHDFCCMDAL